MKKAWEAEVSTPWPQTFSECSGIADPTPHFSDTLMAGGSSQLLSTPHPLGKETFQHLAEGFHKLELEYQLGIG